MTRTIYVVRLTCKDDKDDERGATDSQGATVLTNKIDSWTMSTSISAENKDTRQNDTHTVC